MSSGLMGQRWVSLYERLDEEEKEREEKAKSEKRRLSMAHATATTVPRRLCMRQQHVVNRGWEAPLVPYHIWTSKFANAMLIVSVLGPWDPLLVVLAWILIASMCVLFVSSSRYSESSGVGAPCSAARPHFAVPACVGSMTRGAPRADSPSAAHPAPPPFAGRLCWALSGMCSRCTPSFDSGRRCHRAASTALALSSRCRPSAPSLVSSRSATSSSCSSGVARQVRVGRARLPLLPPMSLLVLHRPLAL